jgi:N-acetyl-gamma-glutamylphosphate reductase
MKIGVVGASGYAGGELLRILSSHPTFSIEAVSAHSNAGELITSLHPHLSPFSDSLNSLPNFLQPVILFFWRYLMVNLQQQSKRFPL